MATPNDSTQIVNRGVPSLTFRREVRAIVNCPNCDKSMELDPSEVDLGHIIQCGECQLKTYYPFERPWYKRTKLVIGYIASLILSFFVGLASNYAYQELHNAKGKPELNRNATESQR